MNGVVFENIVLVAEYDGQSYYVCRTSSTGPLFQHYYKDRVQLIIEIMYDQMFKYHPELIDKYCTWSGYTERWTENKDGEATEFYYNNVRY